MEKQSFTGKMPGIGGTLTPTSPMTKASRPTAPITSFWLSKTAKTNGYYSSYLDFPRKTDRPKIDTRRLLQEFCRRTLRGRRLPKHLFWQQEARLRFEKISIEHGQRERHQDIFLQGILDERDSEVPHRTVQGLQVGSEAPPPQIFHWRILPKSHPPGLVLFLI